VTKFEIAIAIVVPQEDFQDAYGAFAVLFAKFSKTQEHVRLTSQVIESDETKNEKGLDG
jgi:hypothetical protein